MTTDTIQAAIDALEGFGRCTNLEDFLCHWHKAYPSIAQLRAQQSAQGWQTIDTAPRDGTEVRLASTLNWGEFSRDPLEPKVGSGFCDMGAFWYVTDADRWRSRIGFYVQNPTHWMPLSQLPATIKAAGGE